METPTTTRAAPRPTQPEHQTQPQSQTRTQTNAPAPPRRTTTAQPERPASSASRAAPSSSSNPRTSSISSFPRTTRPATPSSTSTIGEAQSDGPSSATIGIATAGGLVVLFILSIFLCRKYRSYRYSKRDFSYDPSRDPINPNDVLPSTPATNVLEKSSNINPYPLTDVKCDSSASVSRSSSRGQLTRSPFDNPQSPPLLSSSQPAQQPLQGQDAVVANDMSSQFVLQSDQNGNQASPHTSPRQNHVQYQPPEPYPQGSPRSPYAAPGQPPLSPRGPGYGQPPGSPSHPNY
ncbi:hypothetical protein BX616_006979 [Lobosporangium transversale]|uniref:Uncharacterized protein n=1 Tax=Lobosporangium transversale TaxID=64571 RepID=A0A1Y2GS93_9FUNG|nr:hypothetical protein BCR41DRAFT_350910 [Lobosporangium transversale]KAF9915066.1 hypothetical protein BX616_006979 [Lobosporangium transversale]ORZ21017.1 hypothetical protein BCR41DRAFT_350910 [Lobosporangium transversale]|eukprot:XP_021882926.1 hypothetical protein BCR41DRAFT_350910 [Lobosporangium transversale]